MFPTEHSHAQPKGSWECLNNSIMRENERRHIWLAFLFMVPYAILSVVSPIIHTIKPQAPDARYNTWTDATEISSASMVCTLFQKQL